MSCDFTEQVSLLLDGELAPPLAERMRKHLTECMVCHQMEEDFLRLRQQIQSYELDVKPLTQPQKLLNLLASSRVPWWKKRIELPAPVLALAAIALLVLVTWSFLIRRPRSLPPSVQVTNVPAQSGPTDQPGDDFSHYDRGERAVIYKVRRSQ